MFELWHIHAGGIVVRLLLAVSCGGAIGLERGWRNRDGGFRTHILVCVGAALFMMLSIFGFGDQHADALNHPLDPTVEPNMLADPSRLAAQVVNGVGFLGAGMIMQNGKAVFGLSTAASIWIVAAIGLCMGAGFFFCGITAAILVLIVQLILRRFNRSRSGS
ncbi:MgtC/SapB family protein [Paenibacillus whitsoniae]|uniref:MgtC/SapB family protein n=1 Tax=Paenibacillus whitsoniae TaxID=2496558 RepID=A0A3S0IDV1_9BACL|nr:MgtC/SapB family protein [Paenibacillus whitsoniae]RTE10769.1 MgtC/SapB family protein [Paenibacillus whitsoniae]